MVVQKMKRKANSYMFITCLHGKLSSEVKVKHWHTLGNIKHAVCFAFELKCFLLTPVYTNFNPHI